ncbi:hypothetical protein AGMMS49965_08520 [Bacteroidia bacterium]|nr:hypothetical protein AGMMS49965_08520 [Bacteroidia bacterium]
MKQIFLTLFFLVSVSEIFAQDSIPFQEPVVEKEYPFIIQDSPAALFTMRQSNEDFLSLYRLGMNEVNKAFSSKVSYITQALFQMIFFQPLTHEEGHRSILTDAGIGSISRPFFNEYGAAYVTGVSDQMLKHLRQTNLPIFTRMYIGGVESDYTFQLREASLLNFGDESFQVLWMEYLLRKIGVVGYYTMGLLKSDAVVEEEPNELDRDIAGMDIYGAVRALHNPTMEFKRYVNYADLQPEEIEFVKRVGWRSLLNLVDPTLFFHKGFNIKDKFHANFSLGYSMAPFGDFIDEHFWLRTRSLKTHFYFRQYENKDTWFPAFGVDFSDIPIANRWSSTVALHGWSQPEDLSFTQTKGKLGGGIDLLFKYRFPIRSKGNCTGISINVGIIAKTQGFLPEELAMESHSGIRLGTSFWFK